MAEGTNRWGDRSSWDVPRGGSLCYSKNQDLPRRPPPEPLSPSKLFLEMVVLKEKLQSSFNGYGPQVEFDEIWSVVGQWQDHEGWTMEEASLAASIVGLQQKLVLECDGSDSDEKQKDICRKVLSREVYINLINSFAKVPEQCRVAENILDYMFDLAETDAQFKPDRRWEYRYKCGHVSSMPDCHSYSSVINCWVSSDARDSATKAEEILNWMERNNIEPNAYCYNNVLKAWSRRGSCDAPERAKAIWNRIPDQSRNKYSFFNMISVLCGASGARFELACEAESLLKDGYNRSLFQPDVKICNRVVASMGRSAHKDAGDRVEALLDWMYSVRLSPDTICYNSAPSLSWILPKTWDRQC